MKRRPRIYYSASQRALMWEHWRKGETLHQIARLFDRYHSSVQRILAESGGIRPAERHRSRSALTLLEREMPFDRPFDAVIGRYVLMYQRDPAATLSALASRLISGGIIAFHELDWGGVRSSPPAPTYDRCCRWVIDALQRGGAEPYMGTKLYSAFVRAALPAPVMYLEAPIGGPADPSGNVLNLLETIFPGSLATTLEQFGIAKASDVAAESLPSRMYEELNKLGSVVVGRSEVGAWARNPPKDAIARSH